MMGRKPWLFLDYFGIVSMLALVLPAVASNPGPSVSAKLHPQPRAATLLTPSPWRTLDLIADASVHMETATQEATSQASPAPASAASPAVAKQAPFSFNHKAHAPLHVECAFCHQGSLTAERAGFPAQQTCMACHAQSAKDNPAIVKLSGLSADARLVPEKPVYLLPDFVNFSHARHHAAAIDCTFCHGDVWQMETVEPHLAMRMKACVDCHRTKQAPVACNTCHEAFQQ
jgi:Cytochrome c7 and related cytochrome c/Class III cytochrome C family